MPTFLLSAMSGIGTVIGGVSSAISSIASMLGSVISTIGGLLQSAASMVMSAVQAIASGVMAVGGLLVQGATAFIGALLKATQSAMAYAKSVNDLRLNTGMGMKEAGATAFKFGAFGITPQMLAQARGNEHHSITKMRGAAWNVDVNDPLSINRKARSFGDGLMGHAQREAFLESMGMNNDKGRWMASLSEEQMQDQMNFTQRTGAALGISPESMSKMAEELPLAQAKLETFLQLVQLKFVDTALPLMEKGIAAISDFISTNAPMIADTFAQALNWIFTEGPKFILRASIQFLSMLSTLVGGMAQITQWLSENSVQILGAVTTIYEAIKNFVNSVLKVADRWNNRKKKQTDEESATDKTVAIQKAGSDKTNPALVQAKAGAEKASDTAKKVAPPVAVEPEKAAKVLLSKAGEPPEKQAPEIAVTADKAQEINTAEQKKKLPPDELQKMMANATSDLVKTQKSIDDSKKVLEEKLITFDQAKITPSGNEASQPLNTAQGRIDGVQSNVQNNKESLSLVALFGDNLPAIRKAVEKTADKIGNNNGMDGKTTAQDWLGRFAAERSRQRYLMETR